MVALLAAVPVAHAASTPSPSARRQAARIRTVVRSAPFFTEVFSPRRGPYGVVITLHRGAWKATGRAAAATEHPDGHAWLRRGWLVVNSSYRPGVAGLRDVILVYKRVRRATRATLPICIVGASAGGNLALLAAARLRDVACVVAEAAPADLVDIASQTAYDPATGGTSTTGPASVHDDAAYALGDANLRTFSPLFEAGRITAPVLLAEAAQDPLIPAQQLGDLCAQLGRRCAASMQLAPGPHYFPHATVAGAALSAFRHAETRLARRAVTAFAHGRSRSPRGGLT